MNAIHYKNKNTGDVLTIVGGLRADTTTLLVPAAGHCTECGAPHEVFKAGFGFDGRDGFTITTKDLRDFYTVVPTAPAHTCN